MRLFERPRTPTAFGVWLRLALLALILLLWAVGCGSAPVQVPEAGPPATKAARLALYARTLRAYLAAGRTPILDVSVPLAAWKDADALVRDMDAAGVALAAVSAPDEKAVWEAVAKHPARLIPLTAAPGPGWDKGDGELISTLRRQLGRGALGVGPVPARGLAEGEAGERRLLVLEAILGLAEGSGVPVILDFPPRDADVGRLERALAAQPRARVVWTEAGYLPRVKMNPGYGHALLRALSLRHVNLSFALSTRPAPASSPVIRPRRNVMYDPGGRLSLEWQTLIDARVDHFVVSGRAGAGGHYVRWMRGHREAVLETLSPASRPRVAFQNAWRLFAGREWKE